MPQSASIEMVTATAIQMRMPFAGTGFLPACGLRLAPYGATCGHARTAPDSQPPQAIPERSFSLSYATDTDPAKLRPSTHLELRTDV